MSSSPATTPTPSSTLPPTIPQAPPTATMDAIMDVSTKLYLWINSPKKKKIKESFNSRKKILNKIKQENEMELRRKIKNANYWFVNFQNFNVQIGDSGPDQKGQLRVKGNSLTVRIGPQVWMSFPHDLYFSQIRV